jgi:hypothetical protein
MLVWWPSPIEKTAIAAKNQTWRFVRYQRRSASIIVITIRPWSVYTSAIVAANQNPEPVASPSAATAATGLDTRSSTAPS